MRNKFLNVAFAGLLLPVSALINVASAGLITETWQGTVSSATWNEINPDTSAPSLLFQVNEIVSWTITYDDESKIAHESNDGPDGISGTDDDYIEQTFDATCPGGNSCTTYSTIADATFELDEILARIYGEIGDLGLSLRDITGSKSSSLAFTLLDETTYNLLFRDDLQFGVILGPSNPWDNYEGFASVAVEGGFYQVLITDVSKKTKGVVSYVAEPSTLVMFALGLIGLASRRFKKQS